MACQRPAIVVAVARVRFVHGPHAMTADDGQSVEHDLGSQPESPENDEYRLLPLENRPRQEPPGDPTRPRFAPVEMAEEPLRFSVKGAFVLTTIAAVLLSGLQFFRSDWVAGVLGVVTFFSLVAIAIVKPKHDIVHIGWWLLLFVYLITSVAAMMQS